MNQKISDTETKTLSSTKWTDLAILVLVIVACALPFLSQPFHMDDGFYMDMARNAQENPLFPHDAPYMYQEIFFDDMGSHSHPPMQIYFLAAVMHLFGEGPGTEWIYHSFAIFYPVLAVVSFYFIAALFVGRPLWPSMMLACCPLFLVMQHTLMTDIPMLAFWLAAIASFLWAVHKKSTGLYAASIFFQFAAMFTSYQSLAVTPLLGFYLLRRGRGWKGWAALVIPPMILAVWFLLSCFHYDRLLWGITLDFIQVRHPLSLDALVVKLLSIFEYQGWLVVFPFFIFYLLARDLKGRLLILVLLIAAGIAQLHAQIAEYRPADKIIFIFGLAAGFFIALEMGKIAWGAFRKTKSRLGFEGAEDQFLSLWFWGVFLYCLFLLTEGSARYVLPLVPPFLICFFRTLEISEISEYRLPPRLLNSARLASGSLVISLAFGLILSHADLEFARIYPRAASRFSRISDSVKSYCVGEWGFRYYMGRMGVDARPADESLIRGGSFVAIAELALPHSLPANLRTMMVPVQTLSFKPDTPLRLLDKQSHAGFYSSGWGLIPFSFSQSALEKIEVQQVNFMVEQLPWAEIQTDSTISPWPGYLDLMGKSSLAVLAKPGSRITYRQEFRQPMQLEILCGVSPDSYLDGSENSSSFAIRQLDKNGVVLAESSKTLQPGIHEEHRTWQKVEMILYPSPRCTLEFGYFRGDNRLDGVGAFAQLILRPVN
jgi:4-amino-4-deoxy-L-arabinose transferase-like glycosyltransferase